MARCVLAAVKGARLCDGCPALQQSGSLGLNLATVMLRRHQPWGKRPMNALTRVTLALAACAFAIPAFAAPPGLSAETATIRASKIPQMLALRAAAVKRAPMQINATDGSNLVNP